MWCTFANVTAALDYDTNELIKNFLTLTFMGSYSLSKDLRELLEQVPLQLTIS